MKKDKTEEKKSKKQKLPKEISQDILKKVFFNLLRAIGIMAYFAVLNLAYSTMKHDRLMGDIEVFAGAFLLGGLYMLERAYKKDNGADVLTGIELLVLAFHSLSIRHIITMFQYEFQYYLLVSSYIISIYYVLKATVLYTKGRKEYLDGLSDISEIVKKDEPIKKEAKKRNSEEDDVEIIKEMKEKKQKKKAEKKPKETKEVKKKSTKKKESEKFEVEEKPKKKRGRPKKEVKEND